MTKEIFDDEKDIDIDLGATATPQVADKQNKKAKEVMQSLEMFFKEEESSYITYEKIAQILAKAPSAAQVRKIREMAKKYKKELLSSSEAAKKLNIEDQIKSQEERKKIVDEELEEEFDFTKERELLEWSRSDSPVRMYLREMGQIPLLTKEEEVLNMMDSIRFATEAFNREQQRPYRLSFSMGFSYYRPGDTAETFLRRMDEAMYQDKRSKIPERI